jgi:hypothetical protein
VLSAELGHGHADLIEVTYDADAYAAELRTRGFSDTAVAMLT